MLYAVNLVKFRIAFTWLSSLRLHASCDPSFHPIVRETKCVCVCVCVCVQCCAFFLNMSKYWQLHLFDSI